MKKIQTVLLTFSILISCFSQRGYAIELHIPQRSGFITDYAQMFSAEDTDHIAEILTGIQTEEHYTVYLLTVPESYKAYIDTLGPMVAKSWNICQDNDDVLLIMTDGKYPLVYVTAGSRNPVITSDTMAAYLSTELFRQSIRTDGPIGALEHFKSEISFARLLPGHFTDDKMYRYFADKYDPHQSLASKVAKTQTTDNILKWIIYGVLSLVCIVAGIFGIIFLFFGAGAVAAGAGGTDDSSGDDD